jgi:hypothetical protein
VVDDRGTSMSLDSYLFEKACYVPDALARVAEGLRLLPPGSLASQEINAFLSVALRHGLMTCCAVAGAEFDGSWVVDISRKGSAPWKRAVKPALEEAIFGADEREERIKASGLPRDHGPGAEPREVDVSELIPRATKCLAALLDLGEILRKHRSHDLEDGRFRSHLGQAFNGATKVLSTLIEADWDVDWPRLLVDRGREGLDDVLAKLEEAGGAWRLTAGDLAPLEEAWLAEVDPVRTPEAERDAERQRRARVTEENRILNDLVIPEGYRNARLDGLLVDRVPGHQACFDYAKTPEGSLVIHGELASGMYEIQWAIARFWFVDELRSVKAVDWHELVEHNLMAQNRALWTCPRLVVSSLRPALLADGTPADPCYAERMLEYRLALGLPTVITIERYGLEMVNLRARTVHLLKQSKNVVLSRLSEEERGIGTMFR